MGNLIFLERMYPVPRVHGSNPDQQILLTTNFQQSYETWTILKLLGTLLLLLLLEGLEGKTETLGQGFEPWTSI